MKIVHICLGGGWYEKNAYQDQLLPHYQRLLGHEVTIIASQNGRWDIENNCYEKVTTPVAILEDGIKIVRIQSVLPQVLNAHVHLFRGLKKHLLQECPNLIFAHGVETLNYLSLSRVKQLCPSVKIVCDNHGDRINSLHHWLTRCWAKFVTRPLIVKRLISITDWFYGTTPSRCDFLHQMYGVPKEKIKLLVMGADDESMYFEQRASIRDSIRTRFCVKDEEFLVVTGGRFNRKKGAQLIELIKAVSSSNYERLKLLVFGPVSDDVTQSLAYLLNERIIFAGEIPSNQVYGFFYAADLVVFTGLHSVLWEQAIASCAPCLFNNIEGFQHVDIGGNCILLNEHSAAYYQKIIEGICSNNELHKTMIEHANSSNAHRFLYSAIAKSVIDDCFKEGTYA